MDSYALDIAHNAAEEAEEQNSNAPDPLKSMFSFAASWGKKIQNVDMDKFVNDVKSQSGEIARLYKQDFVDISEMIKTGASKGLNEINTKMAKMKSPSEEEAISNTGEASGTRDINQDDSKKASTGFYQAKSDIGGIFASLKQQFQKDKLREHQTKFQTMMKGLGNDLEELMKEAIIIEAPNSGATDQQRAAARKIIYDRKKAQIMKIQNDIDTYLVEPNDRQIPFGDQDKPIENKDDKPLYQQFLDSYDQKAKEQDMPKALEENSDMKKIYDDLVPSKIEKEEFWKRYYFKIWLLETEEERRKKLVREAAAAMDDVEEFDWGSDDEGEEVNKEDKKEEAPNPKDIIKVDSEIKNSSEKPNGIPGEASVEDKAGKTSEGNVAEKEPKTASKSTDSSIKVDSKDFKEVKDDPKTKDAKSQDDHASDDDWDTWE